MKPSLARPFVETGLVTRLGLGAMIALCLSAGQAQTIYRIVGPDGKISFSDKPPAAKDDASATTSKGKTLPLSGSSAALPYELRQVVARYPVTLYTTDNCGPCGSGRSLLTSRGVPFNERTVTTAEDAEALQRLAGESSLPFLTIGGQRLKGFSDSEWTQFLDAAGYPKTSALPSGYRNGLSGPLVVVQKPAAPVDSAQTGKAGNAPAPQAPVETPPPNPAGITF
ncbi:MAG: glutaredoxin family protein [Rhodoferax sp.]|nr:glutaredoxin family protein [Rhodoferax sp.]